MRSTMSLTNGFFTNEARYLSTLIFILCHTRNVVIQQFTSTNVTADSGFKRPLIQRNSTGRYLASIVLPTQNGLYMCSREEAIVQETQIPFLI